MTRILWHPAFVQAFRHELEGYLDMLTFESEYQLTTEPLRIDLLIIKKEKGVVIEKNIARIFRSCNVVEYKSPSDHVTIEGFGATKVVLFGKIRLKMRFIVGTSCAVVLN